MARCSRCGWEYDLEIYVCDNCGYILKREPIEKIPIFKRPEAKVYKPNKPIVRLLKIIYPMTTPYAFRDINNKKDKKGGRRIVLFSALFLAWWVWAISLHMNFTSYRGTVLQRMSLGIGTETGFSIGNYYVLNIHIFLVSLVFFVFGVIYYTVVIFLYNWAFRLAGNFSVQLSDILAVRFNVKRKKTRFQTILSGAARLRRKKLGQEDQYSFEKAAQGQKVLTKISQTGLPKIMNYAYVPFVVVNLLSFIFLLVFLPTVPITDTVGLTLGSLETQLTRIWDSPVWFVLDLLQIIAMIWIAILVSIAQREIGNANTTRLLIGNLIMAGIISFTTIMLRPTMGAGSWNLIDLFSGIFG